MAQPYGSLVDERAKTNVLKPVKVDVLTPLQIKKYQLLMQPGVKLELNQEDSTLGKRRNRLD